MTLYFLYAKLCDQRNFTDIRYLTQLWVNKNGDYPEVPDLIKSDLINHQQFKNESSIDFKELNCHGKVKVCGHDL